MRQGSELPFEDARASAFSKVRILAEIVIFDGMEGTPRIRGHLQKSFDSCEAFI